MLQEGYVGPHSLNILVQHTVTDSHGPFKQEYLCFNSQSSLCEIMFPCVLGSLGEIKDENSLSQGSCDVSE